MYDAVSHFNIGAGAAIRTMEKMGIHISTYMELLNMQNFKVNTFQLNFDIVSRTLKRISSEVFNQLSSNLQ